MASIKRNLCFKILFLVSSILAIVLIQIKLHNLTKFNQIPWDLISFKPNDIQMTNDTTNGHLTAIERRFKQRLDTVRRFCTGKPRQHSPHAEDNPFNVLELYDYYEANIFVCSPPKAASTTLDEYLIDKILKPMCKNSNYSMVRRVTKTRHRINETMKFESVNELDRVRILIVREPLSRILSCWYNKFSGLMGNSQVRV